ncbi:aldo/keto reductase [Gloeothece citriformis PCC 7424]|uniref:Aldo/keto reductase n=1 Tax=Gloeothece citriformis (strain PCC 7424) TaxID=65393 RepID=B7K6X4_GLOC7|nr:aldo/keto reductase [Gloeothece citriformis]ACK72673.1 aldo/keto reductase [Gloeothece citriformis PCC 7424]
MKNNRRTRRNFLLASLAVASGVSASCRNYFTRSPKVSPALAESLSSNPSAEMPQRVLGKTNISVPILGLGGSASPLSRPDQEGDAIAILERAFDLGIRYFDTAANYGPSEERIGKALSSHRQEIILATKTSSRNRDSAWRDLEQSLQRLQTDYLDLWQFHALTYDWDVNTILEPKQGAIKAALEAKEQGLIRGIGITGHHNPEIIVEGLRRYVFDTALVPINAADKHHSSSFIKKVLPVAQEKNTGIIAMKVPAYGRLFKPGVLDGMGQAMGYALSQSGVSCCIIAADTLSQLEENVRVAQEFKPLSSDELGMIEQRTAKVWRDSSFFRDWG